MFKVLICPKFMKSINNRYDEDDKRDGEEANESEL